MGGILRNRWIRVQGVAMVLYVFSQIDKANIAVAYPGIRGELGLTAAAVGFATGMFAWGYLVLQIPVGRLTSAWSAKRTILILCACWSIVAASTALVQTETQLIVNRFVLGMSEGGILPAVVVVMRAWFTQRERARANLSLLGTPIALAIGNSVCGFAVSLVGWRWMFVVTAIPSLLWCLVWWWAVEDDPRDARWLDPAVKEQLVAELEAEARTQPADGERHWLAAMWHPTVVILAVYNLLGLTALWGLTFWLPTLIVEQGRRIGMAGLLAAVPYVVAVVMTYFISASSDRHAGAPLAPDHSDRAGGRVHGGDRVHWRKPCHVAADLRQPDIRAVVRADHDLLDHGGRRGAEGLRGTQHGAGEWRGKSWRFRRAVDVRTAARLFGRFQQRDAVRRRAVYRRRAAGDDGSGASGGAIRRGPHSWWRIS